MPAYVYTFDPSYVSTYSMTPGGNFLNADTSYWTDWANPGKITTLATGSSLDSSNSATAVDGALGVNPYTYTYTIWATTPKVYSGSPSSIPANQTITGVQFNLLTKSPFRAQTPFQPPYLTIAQLSQQGGLDLNSHGGATGSLPANLSYGNSTDKWGRNMLSKNITSDYGFAFQFAVANTVAVTGNPLCLSGLQMTVYTTGTSQKRRFYESTFRT